MAEAAYPFIDVRIDTTGLTPVLQRAPGAIAVVGKATGGEAAANTPEVITSPGDATTLFGAGPGDALSSSIELALLQDPQPSKVYGVRVDGDACACALAALEGADDVPFVALAAETAAPTKTKTDAPL